MADQFHITQSKKEELEKELQYLKGEKRAQISERVQTARAHGDLRENTEYEQARTDQGENESKIGSIEHILKHAVVIEKSGSDQIELGSTVVIQKADAEAKTFSLVTSTEADMAAGRLSVDSPIGRAILGKKKGDTALVMTPGGETQYSIIDVS